MKGRRRPGRLRVTFSVYFLVLLTCMFSLDRTGLAALAFFGVLVHETGHLATLAFFRVPVEGFSFRIFGAEILAPRRAQLAYSKEAAVDLSGPAANFLLCALMLPFLRFGTAQALFAVSLLLGLFNLLPVVGLDGGHALEALLLARLAPGTVRHICLAVSVLTLLPAGLCGVWLLHRARNATLLISALYLMAVMLQTGGRNRLAPGRQSARRKR